MRRLTRLCVLVLLVAMGAPGCSDDTDPGTPDGSTVDMAALDQGAGDGPAADQGGPDVAISDGPPSDQAPPDQGADSAAVTFSGAVQPIFTGSCASANCHGGSSPSAGMSLESGKAYSNLVGVTSTQCSTLPRVKAGDPTQSYLIQKLEGQGSCFTGQKMPIGAPLDATKLAQIKGWISAGAANN